METSTLENVPWENGYMGGPMVSDSGKELCFSYLRCGGLNYDGPRGSCLNTVSPWRDPLGRIGMCGLIRTVLLGAGLLFQNTCTLSLSLPCCYISKYELSPIPLLYHHGF